MTTTPDPKTVREIAEEVANIALHDAVHVDQWISAVVNGRFGNECSSFRASLHAAVARRMAVVKPSWPDEQPQDGDREHARTFLANLRENIRSYHGLKPGDVGDCADDGDLTAIAILEAALNAWTPTDEDDHPQDATPLTAAELAELTASIDHLSGPDAWDEDQLEPALIPVMNYMRRMLATATEQDSGPDDSFAMVAEGAPVGPARAVANHWHGYAAAIVQGAKGPEWAAIEQVTAAILGAMDAEQDERDACGAWLDARQADIAHDHDRPGMTPDSCYCGLPKPCEQRADDMAAVEQLRAVLGRRAELVAENMRLWAQVRDMEDAQDKRDGDVPDDLYWSFTGGMDTCFGEHDGEYRECCWRAGLAYVLKLREQQVRAKVATERDGDVRAVAALLKLGDVSFRGTWLTDYDDARSELETRFASQIAALEARDAKGGER